MIFALSIILAPVQALAEDDDDEDNSAPGIYGTIYIEYQSDHLLSSSDQGDGSHTYASHALDLEVKFNNILSLYSTVVYEPARGYLIDFDFVNDDQFMEDQGVYLEELYLQVNFGHFKLFGGKFSPNFGIAWDYVSGIYGADWAEDYEMTDILGFGGKVARDDTPLGDVELTVAGFVLDRTQLSNTLFQNTGKNLRSDGGAGNTDGIESYLIAFDVENLLGREDLGAHFAYMHRGAGIGDYDDEDSFAVAFYGERDLRDDLSLEWIAEAVFIDNYDASERDINYYTVGLLFEYLERYNFAFVYTQRDGDDPWNGSFNDQMFAFSFGIDDVWRDWDVEIGYRYTDDDEYDLEDHVIGFLVSKEINFKRTEHGTSYK